tara:strand:- start:155 stop:376 length:222 start_codon:yes stop_codon:yes gene_type:complete
MRYFDLPTFLIFFALGVLVATLFAPRSRIVKRHPTPDNLNQIVYTDKSGNQYRYQMKTVPCKGENAKPLPVYV